MRASRLPKKNHIKHSVASYWMYSYLEGEEKAAEAFNLIQQTAEEFSEEAKDNTKPALPISPTIQKKINGSYSNLKIHHTHKKSHLLKLDHFY
jgi:hypothetical protein